MSLSSKYRFALPGFGAIRVLVVMGAVSLMPQPAGPTVTTMATVYPVPVLNGGTITNPGTVTLPGTIAASGTFVSSVLPTFDLPHVAVSAKMDQAGTLSVQRYLDGAGTLPAGAAVTAAMTKNTLASIDNLGTVISQSMTVPIVNSATVAANVDPGFGAVLASV